MNAPAVGLRLQPREASLIASRITVPPLLLRVVAFALLSVFATAHWVALVDPAPFRRALAVSALGCAVGVLIALSGELPRPAGLILRLLLVLGALVLSLAAVGISLRLMWPTRWDTLSDRISGGLNAAGAVSSWPYGGPNRWLRLTTLAGAPLAVTVAAALAFWPRRSRPWDARTLGIAAMVLLVALYGVAVAARPFGAQGLRGVGLLAGIAAWLWLPRLHGREAAGAAVALAVAALFGLTFMKPVASDQPWVDYRQWSWTLPKEKTVAFDWTHKYGPLEWPRKGTTLLLVKAKQAHYWKAENLDSFDGRRWTNGGTRDTAGAAEDVIDPRRAWNETIEFTVRGLASQVIVGAGTLKGVKGDGLETVPLSDATYVSSGPLQSGDTYTVSAYIPDPSAREMRAAPAPPLRMQRYTALDLVGTPGLQAPLRHSSPLTGDRAAFTRLVRESPYSRVYRLAKGIAAGATTDYDVVKRIDAYLEKNYAYSENVPSHLYPLNSFLFQDKRGYCQQFSGAAALMLRMLGIPTRVASGFTPGTLNKDTHEYVVQDLDAHSWIEVWFSGIGWVPFDPTPALAPAQSQSAAAAAASAARGDARDRLPRQSLDRLLGTRPDGSVTLPDENTGKSLPWGPILLGLSGGLLGLSALIVWWRARRRARTACLPPCGDADVDGLIRLMARLGLEVRPGTTLFELESRLATVGGPDAARYARRLRERRFGAGGRPAPGRDERRRARRALADGVRATRLARIRLALPDNPLQRR